MSETLPLLECLLQKTMGLDPASIGKNLIENAIRKRMKQLSIENLEHYLDRVLSSQDERQELVEEITVPETWFFRDQTPFALVGKHLQQLQQRDPLRTFKILSMPCSTGEEPYSIAMTLFSMNLAPPLFSIDAFDINTQSLKVARAAVYGRNSFRTDYAKQYIDTCFIPKDKKYEVCAKIKQAVKFSQTNVLDLTLNTSNSNSARYDAIYCRNLLIYFSNADKQRVLELIHHMLKTGGLLFVGHAEANSVPQDLFERHGSGSDFCFSKSSAAMQKQKLKLKQELKRSSKKTIAKKYGYSNPTPTQTQEPMRARTNRNPSRPDAATGTSPGTQKIQAINARSDLDLAIEMADTGDYRQARERCASYINSNSASDHAWFLMALIEQSLNDNEAGEKCLRKVIYLNPKHYEALIHLALLLRKQGNEEQASRLLTRAERISQGNIDNTPKAQTKKASG